MPYHVEFMESVLSYLAGVDGLTADDLDAIVLHVTEELGRDADRFLALRPLAHESLCFRYDYPHLAGQLVYDFDVSAENRAMGVVQVVYVEYTTHPTP